MLRFRSVDAHHWATRCQRHARSEAPFTTAGFEKMVERAGISAKLAFKVHPHMLRHACGFALANKGQKQ